MNDIRENSFTGRDVNQKAILLSTRKLKALLDT